MQRSRYSYDLANRLTALTHQDNTPATFAGYDYAYDAANRITSIDSHLDGLSEFTYDNAGQLSAADHASQTGESYTYDGNGNRIGGDYDTDPNNLTVEDDDYTYGYDDEGNRILRTEKATRDYIEYGWDHRNRLTLVTFKNSSHTTTKKVAYEYDAFDRRVRKRVDTDGNTTWDRGEQYVYDGEHIALVFDDDGDLIRRNLFGPAIDQILASEFIGTPNDTNWYFVDHLGTVRDVYSFDDVLNDLVSEGHIEYDSFGNIVDGALVAQKAHYAYTGREWDADVELYYYRARWYDAKLGQFINEDPIGFAANDPNQRRVVANNVTSKTDPFGLEENPFNWHLAPEYQLLQDRERAREYFERNYWRINDTFEGANAFNRWYESGAYHEALRADYDARRQRELANEQYLRAPRLTPIPGTVEYDCYVREQLLKRGVSPWYFAFGLGGHFEQALIPLSGLTAQPILVTQPCVEPFRPTEIPESHIGRPLGARPSTSRNVGPVSGLPRTGSAATPPITRRGVHPDGSPRRIPDPHHAFPDVVDNFARDATEFTIPTRGPGGTIVGRARLYQVQDSLNGEVGIFEWIVENGAVTHRRFIPGGRITGSPNQAP
jgi:RHS repeat-associated protein